MYDSPLAHPFPPSLSPLSLLPFTFPLSPTRPPALALSLRQSGDVYDSPNVLAPLLDAIEYVCDECTATSTSLLDHFIPFSRTQSYTARARAVRYTLIIDRVCWMLIGARNPMAWRGPFTSPGPQNAQTLGRALAGIQIRAAPAFLAWA